MDDTPPPSAAPTLQTSLVEGIREHVRSSPLNRLAEIDGTPMFDEPLIGFADGDDPLFALYKAVVADYHLTPREALAAATGRPAADFAQVSVVSWVLPITGATRASNRQMREGPSQRWNHTRFPGEDLNDDLRRHVVGLLAAAGQQVVAPVLHPSFVSSRSAMGYASSWSERHIAFAAGLGTFSLSDGLITARGIAHRCGSIVTDAIFVPTLRPYSDRREYCLFTRDGSCGACIDRCPAGAITPEGHDKDRCHEYVMVTLAGWAKRPGYVGPYAACGLCQTGVPCEDEIPQ